ncbi:uncharacterized protein [Canis lupus baileyi]|uniref:uncharacterized protein n=1 Tax=Canis lupus baileyi TaxID=143281 RepID=UPI003B978E29
MAQPQLRDCQASEGRLPAPGEETRQEASAQPSWPSPQQLSTPGAHAAEAGAQPLFREPCAVSALIGAEARLQRMDANSAAGQPSPARLARPRGLREVCNRLLARPRCCGVWTRRARPLRRFGQELGFPGPEARVLAGAASPPAAGPCPVSLGFITGFSVYCLLFQFAKSRAGGRVLPGGPRAQTSQGASKLRRGFPGVAGCPRHQGQQGRTGGVAPAARPRAVSGGGGWGEPRRPEDKPWESQGAGWWGGGPCRGARVCRALAGRYVGGSWGAGGCLSPGTGTRTQALLPRGQPASHVRDWARPWVPVEAPGTAARVCLLLGAHGLGLLVTCPCPGHSRRLALPSSWAPGPQAWPGLPRSRDCISPPSGNVAAAPAPAGGPAGPLVREPEPGLLQLSGPEQPEPATEDPWVGRPSWPWGPSRLFPGGCGETPPQTPAPSSPGARDPGLSSVLRCWGRVSPRGRGLDRLNPRAPRLQRNANTSARGRILGAVPSPSGRFRLLLGVSVSRWEPHARTICPGNCRRRLASSLLTF